MATKYIDINLHVSAFPATYIGVGTLIGNPLVTDPGTERVSGYFTATGEDVIIPLGMLPTHIVIVDVTDNIQWDWYRGLAATNTIKTVAAGTRTIDTNSAIVITTDLAGNASVKIAAATAVNASLLIYAIEG
jgi:hypothetical protein